MSSPSTYSHSKKHVSLVAVMILAFGAAVAITDTETAEASTTTTLLSAASISQLAEAAALNDFPGGAGTAVVSQDSDASSLLAATYASRNGVPFLLVNDGSSALGVLPALASLGADQVVLVSDTAAWFTSGFVADLTSASISVDDRFEDALLFTGWAGVATLDPHDSFVLAQASEPDDVNLAAALSFATGAPLVLWDSTTSSAQLATFFSAVTASNLIFVSNPEKVPFDDMSDDQAESLFILPTSDPDHTFAWVASRAQQVGMSTNDLYLAASDDVPSLAIAGATASLHNALLAPAGLSTSLSVDSRGEHWLSLWKDETVSVTLVGTGLSAPDLTLVASPTGTSHPAAPSFRITDVTRSGTNYSYAATAVPGATSYTAYDTAGAILATSGTPTFLLPHQQNAMLLVAADSSGELARIDVRMNEYSDSQARETVTLASTSAGTNHLVFLGTDATPRLVSRTVADPFDMDPSPSKPVPVAITCELTYTDSGMDPTKQYSYIVEKLTPDAAHACDPLIPEGPAVPEETVVSQVPIPATSFPWLRGDGSAPLQASATISGTLLSDAIADSQDEVSRQTTALAFRWTAYIPEEYVGFPGHSGYSSHPLVAYGGDNRMPPYDYPDYNGSARFTQTIHLYLGSSHHVDYFETMGTTYMYRCTTSYSCLLSASSTAPLSELWLISSSSTPTTGSAKSQAAATNPLGPPVVTQPIDVVWSIDAKPSGLHLYGYHDLMPKHEFFWGRYPGQAFVGYDSPYLGSGQLPCLFSSPSIPLPLCHAIFNVHL